MNKSKSMKRANIINQTLIIIGLTILCIAILAPFVLLVSVSFSNEKDVLTNGYSFWPRKFDLAAYKFIFDNPTSIINAYKVTAIFSVSGMILGLFFRSQMAYCLSWGKMRGKRFLSFYLYFTMLFGGGLVPSYILITQYLHLANTIWVYIIPGLISPWDIFMMRTFFKGLPYELYESSVIDGASEYRIYAQMVLPLSKPILATLALTSFLGGWNNWNTSLLYIDDPKLFSLQFLLQKIMRDLQLLQSAEQTGSTHLMSVADIPSETTRMAMAIVVAGPALVIFPFFQKYFVKGLTIGSVKG